MKTWRLSHISDFVSDFIFQTWTIFAAEPFFATHCAIKSPWLHLTKLAHLLLLSIIMQFKKGH